MVDTKGTGDSTSPGSWEPDLGLNGDETRNRILNIVGETPGLNIQEIATELGVTRTSIVYHVRFLTNHGKIAIRRQGHHRLHFPPSMHTKDQAALCALRVQSLRLIIQTVFFQPHPTKKELEEHLFMTPRTIRRSLKRLAHDGLLHSVTSPERRESGFELDPRIRALIARNRQLLGDGLPVLEQPKGIKGWLFLLPHTWRTFLSPW